MRTPHGTVSNSSILDTIITCIQSGSLDHSTTMPSICGPLVQSKRGLLAFLWSIVTFLAFVAFFTAMVFAMSTANADVDGYNDDGNNNNEANGEGDEINPEMAVTSRAMAFAALWTAVLASLLSIFGTVILGFQSPTGQYYTCCSGNVHRTTPLGLGAFMGALLMFANMTLVCSVLFGEFEVSNTLERTMSFVLRNPLNTVNPF